MLNQAKPASRPRLGRGLSSLVINSAIDGPYVSEIQTSAISRPMTEPLESIPINQIAPNPFQPRRDFKAEDIDQLAQSIAQQGLLQPLLVCRSGEVQSELPYVLIAGERRLRAAKQAGLATVPCTVRAASRQQMLELALVENIQRSDLNPIEKALAYRDYIDRFSMTQADAAQRLGQPRATVANYLRLLELDESVQRMLLEEQLTFGHAKVLAGLAGQTDRQVALARKAARDGLSVRQLEVLAADGSAPAAGAEAPRVSPIKAPYLRDIEEQLTAAVGTRVSILPGRAKHSGRVIVSFYSLDDFDRIIGRLGLKIQS